MSLARMLDAKEIVSTTAAYTIGARRAIIYAPSPLFGLASNPPLLHYGRL